MRRRIVNYSKRMRTIIGNVLALLTRSPNNDKRPNNTDTRTMRFSAELPFFNRPGKCKLMGCSGLTHASLRLRQVCGYNKYPSSVSILCSDRSVRIQRT